MGFPLGPSKVRGRVLEQGAPSRGCPPAGRSWPRALRRHPSIPDPVTKRLREACGVACAFLLAGAFAGIALIHTTAAVAVSLDQGRSPLLGLADAFSPNSLGFLAYHAAVGALIGLGFSMLVSGMRRRERAQDERHRALKRQFLKAQRLESVGRLAAGVAHDFNNMLTAMQVNAHLANELLPPGSPARDHLREAADVARRAAHLPRQLLAFSRQQPAEPRVVSPNAQLEGMRRMLERLLGEDVSLVTALQATGNLRVDPGQFEQGLVNLAVNARDAMPTGGTLTLET